MSFHVYVLRCADGSYYTGHTDDLERRFAEHQTCAYRGYTFDRRPVELVWSDEAGTREEALAFELRFKGWSRAKKESFIAKDWERLSRYAMPPKERQQRSKAKPQPVPAERSRGTSSSESENSATAARGSASTALGIVPRLRSGGTIGGGKAENKSLPPVIVLVRPQLAENIGKAARAMLNFGLAELRLVSPRDGWPNPDAGPTASGADAVLAGTQVFDSVAEAVADCAQVYATTVRKRGVTKPVVDAAEAAAQIRAAPGRSAILFGPERAGLETDDVALARAILTIPVNPEFSSLNLAQAVILVAYEWSRGEALAQPTLTRAEPSAPQVELDGMIEQFDAMIDAAGFYFPPPKVPSMRRNVRSILTKPGWTTPEVRTIRGMLSALQFPRSSKRSNS